MYLDLSKRFTIWNGESNILSCIFLKHGHIHDSNLTNFDYKFDK